MNPTVNQLLYYKRTKKPRKNRRKALNHCPQKKGVVVKTRIVSPKKPNSAKRRIARVKILSNRKMITCYVTGEGAPLSQHNVILVRGGRVRDLPGVQYKVIRGVLDAKSITRARSRSKYGCAKEKGF